MRRYHYKSGASREQAQLLPARIDDYVGSDNAVRAIDAFVASLDLAGLGFSNASGGGGPGQPSYHPADLAKLYLYGYINQVRSSRRLAREAERNVEVMWLLRGLRPGYRTIGEFRRVNIEALKAANREFVRMAGDLDLLGGTLVAIDGAFFHGDASKASIKTKNKLTRDLTRIDAEIEAYAQALDINDAAEAMAEDRGAGASGSNHGGDAGGATPAEQIAALKAKRDRIEADIKHLEESGQTQLSLTDKDARLLAKSGQTVAGYNVQCAIDDKHKLIAASEVVNDGNDTGQLHAMATAAKVALGAETLTVLADGGYFNGDTLKACEASGITAYVPTPDRDSRMTAEGRFSLQAFTYDVEKDAYRCPNGALLEPSGEKQQSGKTYICYNSKKADCVACPLRARCLSAKGERRTIYRWTEEAVLERHRARMQSKAAEGTMRRRSALAEHPFGTLKCRAGYRHFLLRGFAKVRGEWSLMALCYNFTRVLNIIGFDRLTAHLAASQPARRLQDGLTALIAAISNVARRNLASFRLPSGPLARN